MDVREKLVELVKRAITDWKHGDVSEMIVDHLITNGVTVQENTAADVIPVRHGRWIDAYPDIEPNPMFMYGICSECGFEQGISKYLNYCPKCGAKMDGGAD